MGYESFGYLSPFYGIPIQARSLIRAYYAWRSCRGALFFLDLLIKRGPPASTASSASARAVERVPPEVWMLVRCALLKQAVMDAETSTLERGLGGCLSVACTTQPYSAAWLDGSDDEEDEEEEEEEVVSFYVGKLWPNRGGEARWSRRNCRKCGTFIPAEATNLVEDEYSSALMIHRLQRLLSLSGLHLPHTELYGSGHPQAKQQLSFIAIKPLGKLDYSGGCQISTGGQEPELVTLETALPAGGDVQIMRFVDEWQLEAVEAETRTYRLTEGKKEEKVVVKPKWRILAHSGTYD